MGNIYVLTVDFTVFIPTSVKNSQSKASQIVLFSQVYLNLCQTLSSPIVVYPDILKLPNTTNQQVYAVVVSSCSHCLFSILPRNPQIVGLIAQRSCGAAAGGTKAFILARGVQPIGDICPLRPVGQWTPVVG